MIEVFIAMINERNAFNRLCESLPKEEADKLRARRRKKAEEDEAHRKALELANASRPRNFWGQ